MSVALFLSGVLLLVFIPASGGVTGGLWWLNTIVWFTVAFLSSKNTLKREEEHKGRTEWLITKCREAAIHRIEDRRQAARNYPPEASRSSEAFVAAGPAPSPQPYGVSHEGAEHLIAEWMRYFGAADAEATRFSGDGGVDVSSTHYIAQVKNHAGSVDVAAIRELAGVVYADGRKPLFFTSGSYSSGAKVFADQTGIALFVYDAIGGTLIGVNSIAERITERGL